MSGWLSTVEPSFVFKDSSISFNESVSILSKAVWTCGGTVGVSSESSLEKTMKSLEVEGFSTESLAFFGTNFCLKLLTGLRFVLIDPSFKTV